MPWRCLLLIVNLIAWLNGPFVVCAADRPSVLFLLADDPGLNVPFIVRWPGVVKPGTTSMNLVSGEDLAPTLLEAAGLSVPARISGKSFLTLLKGDRTPARQYLFAERGPHGSTPVVSANMFSSSYDLSRCVRSDRFKLIYNCTPWIPYSPVDSAGNLAWKQAREAAAARILPSALMSTYFTTPRPVYELYDLQSDPSELENLSGQASLADVEQQLRAALSEKMIRDFDYLPLPAQIGEAAGPARRKAAAKKKAAG